MMKPLAPYDDRAGDESRDFAAAGKYSLFALERMLRDCAEQPDWRLRAKLCAAYYDGKQLSDLQKWACREEDLQERAINLIRPLINSVLGQEARSRTAVKIEADADEYSDVADVISAKLKEADRETNAPMGISNAYGSMVKKGLGWVHVCRNSDPLAYPYRFEDVPIDEIWWDWRGQRGVTLDDRCRWLVRMRMVDLDELQAAMPEFKGVLERSVEGWEEVMIGGAGGVFVGEPGEINLREAWENERRFSNTFRKWDWMDSARKMVKVFEVWYRVPAEVAVLHMGPTKKVPYDANDPRHVEAVARGLVKVSKGTTSQVRRALYAGPHRLLDEATKRRHFPYVPFFAFRDDEDYSPYGLIDGMVAPQDEYNERRLRIQWMLKARQIQMDGDALDTQYNSLQDIADKIMRPDMVAITNAKRLNSNGPAITVKNELNMQPEQFKVMEDSKQLLQDTIGRYGSNLGSAQVQSGIANGMLIEQGEQAMGEMNDNYTYSRRCAYERLVDLIIEDHSTGQIQVPVGVGRSRRVVVLNAWDQQTQMPVNMVKDAEVRTALADTPNTPAYRQQTQMQVKEIITALGNNPQAVAILAPMYLESTGMPNRQEAADQLRKVSGIPVPGDKEGQAAAEQQAQQMQAAQMEMTMAAGKAKIDVDVSAAERNRSQARNYEAQAELLQQKVAAGGGFAEVEAQEAQTDASRMAANDEDALINEALAEAQA